MKIITIEFGTFKGVRELLRAINPKFSKVGCIIIAPPGYGKSAMACAMGLEDMTMKRIREYKDACKKIDYLIQSRGVGLEKPPQKHLVYCSGFKISKFRPKMQSYDFLPWHIGLHDDNYETQYFEKHALRIIDEIQTYFNSRDTLRFPNRVSSNMQKSRHYDIFNIGTAQEGIDVEVKIRRLFHFIEISNLKTVTSKLGLVEQTIWTCNYLGSHRNWEKYYESKGDEQYILARVIFKFNGDIFRHYNQTSCEDEFDEISNSFSSHENDIVQNSVNAPPGYYKKSEEKSKNKGD